MEHVLRGFCKGSKEELPVTDTVSGRDLGKEVWLFRAVGGLGERTGSIPAGGYIRLKASVIAICLMSGLVLK